MWRLSMNEPKGTECGGSVRSRLHVPSQYEDKHVGDRDICTRDICTESTTATYNFIRKFIHSGYFYSASSSRTKGDESTNEPPRPTIQIQYSQASQLAWSH